MPETSNRRPAPATPGPSALDIARRYSTSKIMRPVNSNGVSGAVGVLSEDEPTMQRALMIRERLMANRMIDTELRTQEMDAEARAAETEVKTLTSRVNLEKARQELSEMKGGGDSPTMMIMGMMMEMLKELRGNSKQGIDPQVAAMLSDTQKDLAEMRASIMGRISDSSTPMETIKSQLETLVAIKTVFEQMNPPTPASTLAVNAAAQDVNTTLMLARLEMDHKLRMAEIDRENTRWDRQVRLEEQKIIAEQIKAENMGKMAGDTLATLAPLIKQATDRMLSGGTLASPAASFTMPAIPVAKPVWQGSTYTDQPMNDTRCPNCGAAITLQVGQTEYECQSCGHQMSVTWTEEELRQARQDAGSQ